MGLTMESRLAKWAKMSAHAAAIITPWFFIFELTCRVGEQERGLSAVVESNSVKLEELDNIAKTLVPWAKSVSGVDDLEDTDEPEIRAPETEISAWEVQDDPPRGAAAEDVPDLEPEEPAMIVGIPEQRHEQRALEQKLLKIDTPQAPVIKDISEAKQYQRARKRDKCADGDFACGLK